MRQSKAGVRRSMRIYVNGTKHYVTEVYVDSVSFTGEAKQSENTSSVTQPTQNTQQAANSIVSIGDLSDFEEILSDDGVPF
jgi:single-strand DNA-binding protein